MNLRNIREKRNNEIAAAKKIADEAKNEKRSLTANETVNLTNHYNKAKDLNEKMATRSKEDLDKSMKVSETRGAKNMEKDKKDKMEIRALGTYLRTGSKAEYRDLDATATAGNTAPGANGNGGVTVPHNVDSQVINKLSEDAPVFSAVRHIPAVSGTMTLPREKNTDEAGFVGETKSLNKANMSLDTVTLEQKRVGAFSELTSELLNDSAINVVNYAVNRLSWSFGKALERAILVGGNGAAGAKSFQPVIGHVTKNETFGGLNVDNMLTLMDDLNPEYLRNAMFVVSRPVFDQVTKLKDGNGQYIIFRDNSSDTPGVFKFKGIPIYVSDTLNSSKTNVVLGDFNQGYAVMVKQGMTIQHVTQDTTQALNGGHLIVLSGLMDGAVINPDALVTANVSGGASGGTTPAGGGNKPATNGGAAGKGGAKAGNGAKTGPAKSKSGKK